MGYEVVEIINKEVEMESIHRQPRKEVMRMGSHEMEKQIRNIRRKNFQMKKWIKNYYELSETRQ